MEHDQSSNFCRGPDDILPGPWRSIFCWGPDDILLGPWRYFAGALSPWSSPWWRGRTKRKTARFSSTAWARRTMPASARKNEVTTTTPVLCTAPTVWLVAGFERLLFLLSSTHLAGHDAFSDVSVTQVLSSEEPSHTRRHTWTHAQTNILTDTPGHTHTHTHRHT